MIYSHLNQYLENLPFLKELDYLELVFFINISMKYSIVEEEENIEYEFQRILNELFEKIENEDKELYESIKDFYDNAYKEKPEELKEFLSNLITKVKFISQSSNQNIFLVINDE